MMNQPTPHPTYTPRKRRIAGTACAAALACACLPSLAWATYTGPTKVTVEADEGSLLKYEVPTVIPFSAAENGALTGPSPEACRIINHSVFGIHVTHVQVANETEWTLCSDASEGSAENSMDFQFGPNAQIDAYAALDGVDVSADSSFDLGYAGSATDSVGLASQGDIARVTMDLSAPVPTATIAWTIAPGASGETAQPAPSE